MVHLSKRADFKWARKTFNFLKKKSKTPETDFTR